MDALLTLLKFWLVGWVAYEVLAVLFMSEWYPAQWLATMPARLFVWPVFACMAVSELISYWRSHRRLNLWWLPMLLLLSVSGGCAQLLVTRAHDASTDRVLSLMPTQDGKGVMVGVDFTKLRKGYMATWKDNTPTMVGATVVDTLTAGMIYYLSTKDKSSGGNDTPDSNSGVVIINNGGTVNYRYEAQQAEQTPQ